MTTKVTYETDGINNKYGVPFPYLDRTHVVVELDGNVLDPSQFDWETASMIATLETYVPMRSLVVRRATPEAALTVYQAGSTLTSEELEVDSRQALYRIEEFADERPTMDAVIAAVTPLVTPGPQGPQGPAGPAGPTGAMATIIGTGFTTADLPATAADGEGFLIGSHVYLWVAGEWIDGGKLAGPQGPPGIGAISGGSPGQIQVKDSVVDYDASWVDPTAELLQFTPSGSGAATRTIGARLRDVATLQDYGAVADGVVNCAPALANASAARTAIHLPAGVYRISSTMTVGANLIFEPGATLKPDNGVAVTLNGVVDAPDIRIFDIANGLATVNGTMGNVAKRLSWWGPAGNGTTDDTAELIAALGTSGILLGRPGASYKVTNRIPILSNTTLDLQGATIDASAMPSQGNISPALRGSAVYGTAVSLTADAAGSATTISANTTGLVPGDLVVIGSDAQFDSSNTNTRVGEIAIVRSATSTTVTLQAPLSWNYKVSDNAYIQKHVPVENVSIRRGRFLASNSLDGAYGILFYGGRNIRIESMDFVGGQDANVILVDTILSSVVNCSFSGSPETNSLAYGVAMGNCSQDNIVSGNRFFNRRHAFTTSNNSAFYAGYNNMRGIVRRIKVIGNVVHRAAYFNPGSGGDAFDSHGGCDQIEFIENTVYGATLTGINYEGRGGVFRGNQILGAVGNGIYIHNETDFEGPCVVENNYCIATGLQGIRVRNGFRGANKGYTSVRVSNNSVEPGSGVGGMYIDVVVDEASRPRIVVSGNNVTSTTDGISVLSASGVSVTGNTVTAGEDGITINAGYDNSVVGNTITLTVPTGRGVVLQGASRSLVSGNTIRLSAGATGSGIQTSTSGGITPHQNVVSNNVISAVSNTSAKGIQFFSNGDYCAILGNVIRGLTTPIAAGTGTGIVNANNVI